MNTSDKAVAIVIGRNEGQRLIDCLASLKDEVDQIVYVDSGSTDGSVEAARLQGAEVIGLDLSTPFTAARARNAGFARALEAFPDVARIQFLDGDCELVSGWIATASQELVSAPDIAIVCGRRREKHPEASLWNSMINVEWDTPVGEALACGGDALMRREALESVGAYNPALIAGEEPEMCFRLREAGWRIRRIDAEMTRHDAAMTRFGQWWQRSRRAGHAYAEGALLHGQSPERFRVAETRRALLWGAVLPLVALPGMLILGPWALLLFLAYPLQVLRLTLAGLPLRQAFFLTLGKFPEAQGALGCFWNRLKGQRSVLIEYK